jgi:hypothetical protein
MFKSGAMFLAGSLCCVPADQLDHILEVFLPQSHEQMGPGGVYSHQGVAQQLGGNHIMREGEFIELLPGFDENSFDVLVQHPALDSFGGGSALCCTPEAGVNRSVKLQGQSAALNVDLEKKRALAVLLWSRLAKEKDERKGCFSG